MKNLLLFFTRNYKRSILISCKKQIWKHYQESGFTSTGYKIYKNLK